MTNNHQPSKQRIIRNFTKAFLFYLYNSLITNIPLYSLRHFYLRRILRIQIGLNTSIHMGCFFTGNKITIGSNTVINRKCYLDGRHGIQIDDNVSISPEVYLLSLTHDPNDPEFKAIGKLTKIGKYCWIGARAIILPGVELATGCVVGAGSVITKSFSSTSIIGGIPGKVIGLRKNEPQYNLIYYPFFNTDITKAD